MKFRKDFYIPITKVDDDERMVYGWASTPDVDSDGEIITVGALEKALPAYMKFPTLRVMHQPKVAGSTKQAAVNADGMYIGAYVISDEEWKMIKAGGYRGFSIGGNVVRKVGNQITELELIEVSLVDVPANKSAVIEVWKRDKAKLNKNAYTMYEAASLALYVKDFIGYLEYAGKDATKLRECLELLKEVVATEAKEKEADPEGSAVDRSAEVFTVKTAEEAEKKIAILTALDFKSNSLADVLRKGVILAMNTKKDELNKGDTPAEATPAVADPKPEGEAPKVETPAAAPEVPAAAPATPATDPKPEGEKPEGEGEEEEEKETGAVAETLKAVAEATQKIETITPKKEEVAKVADAGIAKAVSSLAGALTKIADTLVGINERLARVEKTPAAPKSRITTVHKTVAADPSAPAKDESVELTKKREELKNLNDLHDQIGPNNFAKGGHSQKASILMGEIAILEQQEKLKG